MVSRVGGWQTGWWWGKGFSWAGSSLFHVVSPFRRLGWVGEPLLIFHQPKQVAWLKAASGDGEIAVTLQRGVHQGWEGWLPGLREGGEVEEGSPCEELSGREQGILHSPAWTQPNQKQSKGPFRLFRASQSLGTRLAVSAPDSPNHSLCGWGPKTV